MKYFVRICLHPIAVEKSDGLLGYLITFKGERTVISSLDFEFSVEADSPVEALSKGIEMVDGTRGIREYRVSKSLH
jgi:hypothetical protein